MSARTATKSPEPIITGLGLPSGTVDKDAIIADLRRQLEASDLSSNADSSVSSSGGGGNGRRRRRRKPKPKAALTSKAPPIILRSETKEGKPVRLQIGLNLDVELELKAKIVGDISLSLV
jgi:hypothetical protein